jgi:hypothetical protein
MEKIIFATLPAAGAPDLEPLLLARSLRAFGGLLADSPLWVLIPNGQPGLSPASRQELEGLGARLLDFELPDEAVRFPFAANVYAAAAAEKEAGGQAGQLAWLDSDTLILGDPSPLLLGNGRRLSCCPVHISNIGAPWNQATDDFWLQVYGDCGVAPERVFPVNSVVEERPLAAYFNAGLLCVHPAEGLLGAWKENFERLYRTPAFEDFYWMLKRYKTFVYQAILAGTVLAALHPDDFQLLSGQFNFPLLLVERMAPERRPARLNDLLTCRYDQLAELRKPAWQRFLPVEEPLKSWLASQLLKPV